MQIMHFDCYLVKKKKKRSQNILPQVINFSIFIDFYIESSSIKGEQNSLRMAMTIEVIEPS